MNDPEIARIFNSLAERYVGNNITRPTTFYFSLDEDEKWTVVMYPGKCEVLPQRAEDADCFFKGSKQMFLDVWNGVYSLSAKDFLQGTIKSNNPLMLKDFVAAFRH